MAKTAIGSTIPANALVSLSLKPITNWDSVLLAVVYFLVALGFIGVLAAGVAIQFATIILNQSRGISEVPQLDIPWWLVALAVIMIGFGIDATAGAKKHVWLTKNLNQDINNKNVVILKPISKSDLK